MKLSCIQMNMAFAQPEENFRRAEALVRQAAKDRPDVIVLPETWNTGFFPREGLAALCDTDCAQVRTVFSALARELDTAIVAGSVSNVRGGRVYNTACVFDRSGRQVGEYDKTHLFSPMDEGQYYTPGERLCRFTLDGVRCAVLICYDIRFPELTRTLAVEGLDVLFLVAQWPAARSAHLRALVTARAIENQMFVACCNSCGQAGQTRYGGGSVLLDPWGSVLAEAGTDESVISATCELAVLQDIRTSIHVFRDRRPELYRI